MADGRVAPGRAASGAPAISGHHPYGTFDASLHALHGVRSSGRSIMMQAAPASGDGSIVWRLLETVGAAIFGALVSLVAFRTRLALMQKELDDLKTEFAEARKDTERRHKENHEVWERHMAEVNRKQAMLLEIVAGIARKVGADGRFSDTLVRYLNEEDKGST